MKPIFHVVVVSDNVYMGLKEDISGELAVKKLKEKGYEVRGKTVVPNRYREILKAINNAAEKSDAILMIGGTGPSPRDITVDVVEAISWRKIPGFGELFRFKSYQQIGYRGIISRAELYLLHNGVAIAVLPGSIGAVELGIEILTGMIDHLIEEAKRYEGEHRIK